MGQTSLHPDKIKTPLYGRGATSRTLICRFGIYCLKPLNDTPTGSGLIIWIILSPKFSHNILFLVVGRGFAPLTEGYGPSELLLL